MFHRILFWFSIVVMLLVLTISTETANAQVVVGGRTYVQVPNGTYFYRTQARPVRGYYVGSPYYSSYYYTPYVRKPYYPPYGNHYYPHSSYYYGPAEGRYGNQRNYRRW